MDVTQILLSAQSVDGAVRKHAEETLKQFQEQNLPGLLVSLSGELASDEKPVDSQKLAGLILKNALDAKEQHRKFELVQRWLSLETTVKSQIKACLLQTLSSPVPEARSTASQVIAKIAGIELPQKQWPELIGVLLSNVHQHPANVKQATLETLGYLCEEVSPDVVDQEHVNKILTAVVQGMNSSEGNNDVRLAATRALFNALNFGLTSCPRDSGTTPLNSLPPRSRDVNCDKCPIDVGMEPFSLFLKRYNSFKFDKFCIDEGIGPEKELSQDLGMSDS